MFSNVFINNQKLLEFNQWFQNYVSAFLNVDLEGTVCWYKIRHSL